MSTQPDSQQPRERQPVAVLERVDGTRIPLYCERDATRTLLLGKSLDCDIVLDDPSVADVHALLYVSEHGLEIEDRSAGWTFVDGTEVTRHRLRPRQALVLGALRLTAHVVPAQAAEPPGSPSAPAPESVGDPRPDMRAAARGVGAFFARAHGGRPMRQEATFAELMADELRRAPWFALSTVLHVAILLLLIWLLPDRERGGRRSMQVGLLGAASPIPDEAMTPPAEEQIVIEDVDEPPLDPVEEPAFEEPLFEDSFAPPEDRGPELPTGQIPIELRRRAPSQDLLAGGSGVDHGGFRKTVAELNAHGLELVFVFDSTGSMDHVLDAAKARIARTLDVLQALVPGARVGVVTYRDSGPKEAYLTRSVPLAEDFYRAANFVHSIRADGGRDEPEAVLDGLRVAMAQRWRPQARRVIVLIGDARAHDRDMKVLERELRRFAAHRMSFVHTIVTPRSRFAEPVASAQRNFAHIAAMGRGEAMTFEDESTLLQQVLALAFGAEYRQNIDAVYAAVEKQRARITSDTARLATDPKRMLEALRQEPVPHEIVHAAIERMDARSGDALARALGDRKLPPHTRHAASYILARGLDLDAPPLDPETEEPLPRGAVTALARQVRERFR